jgi:signal transduction histidine kinase
MAAMLARSADDFNLHCLDSSSGWAGIDDFRRASVPVMSRRRPTAPRPPAKGRSRAAELKETEARAESAARKCERLLRQAEALSHTGSWELDLLTGEIFNTDENLRLWFSDDRSKEKRFEDYTEAVHADDRPRVAQRHQQLLNRDQPRDAEFRIVWPDGSVHWNLGRAIVVRDESGKPVRMYGTNMDVTERKRAEEELARRERQQAAIAQLSLSALRPQGLQPLFDEAVELVSKTLRLEHCMVMEAQPEEGVLRFRAGAGPLKEGVLARVTVSMAPGFMGWFSIKAESPVVIADLPSETRFAPCEILINHGVKSGINVPISGRERPFGVLGAHSTQSRSFSPDEVNFVWAMANVLATSIEQTRATSELAEKREQLQALSRKLIEAQETERRAVARELHDDFGQVLTALKLNLQRHEGDQSESIELVDGAIERMRDLAQDLRPPLLDELGLEASLRWYVEREARRAGLEFDLALEPLEKRPPPSLETTCFRVAQEALTNVIRHAQAARVEVWLRVEGDQLQLTVRDEGKGFDVAAARRRAARGGSQGLLGMQERVGLAGGELEIDSAKGRGTTVRARLPLAGGAGP